MWKSANLAITLLAFLCAIHQSFQCRPSPDYEPPTIAELTQKAPIVGRGFVVKKVGNINRYKACLYISHVYKGSGVKSYICVSKFGSTAACLSDPAYGVEYLFFLNRKVDDKLGTEYEARYDGIATAAQVFKKDLENGVRDGKCCPGSMKKCNKYLKCRSGRCGPLYCSCRPLYSFKRWINTGPVFLDVQKVFDTVSHPKLLSKLRNFGVHNKELNWFEDYLSERRIQVGVNGSLSSPFPVHSGVPQGSILRPLHFIMYMNDLSYTALKSSLIMYADDAVIYFAAKNVDEITVLLNADLKIIGDWAINNEIYLHQWKLESVLYGTHKRRFPFLTNIWRKEKKSHCFHTYYKIQSLRTHRVV